METKIVIQIIEEKSDSPLAVDQARRAALSLIVGSQPFDKFINQLRECLPGRPAITAEIVPAPRDPNKRLPKLPADIDRERQAFYASLSPARRAAAGLSHMPHKLAPFGHVPAPPADPEPEDPPIEETTRHRTEYEAIFKPGRSLRTPPGAFAKKRK